MKIVYVYPTLATWGGVERILVDKMNLLASLYGYDIYILTYNQGAHKVPYELNRRVHHIDLKVRTHAQYQYHGLRRLWEGWRRMRWLRHRLADHIAAIAPDALVTTTSGELSLLLGIKGSIPLVVESHGGYDHLIDYADNSWLHRRDVSRRYRLLHRADIIVALTDGDARKWQQDYRQTRVVPNVAHLNPTGRYSDGEQKRAVFVGRLAVQKGIPELMEAWRKVNERHSDWLLCIYGEGDERMLQPMPDGVSVFAPVSNVFEKYAESSMLLLTSRWEPFGLVIPEAMSCGLPVVSFEGDGPSSIITDGSDGFVVKNRSTDEFANRVCQLIEDQELRRQMGQQAIATSQRYTAERIMPMWRDLFESLKKK